MGMEEVTPFLILITVFLTTFSNACISTQHTLLKYISLRSVVCIAYKINLNLLIYPMCQLRSLQLCFYT